MMVAYVRSLGRPKLRRRLPQRQPPRAFQQPQPIVKLQAGLDLPKALDTMQ